MFWWCFHETENVVMYWSLPRKAAKSKDSFLFGTEPQRRPALICFCFSCCFNLKRWSYYVGRIINLGTPLSMLGSLCKNERVTHVRWRPGRGCSSCCHLVLTSGKRMKALGGWSSEQGLQLSTDWWDTDIMNEYKHWNWTIRSKIKDIECWNKCTTVYYYCMLFKCLKWLKFLGCLVRKLIYFYIYCKHQKARCLYIFIYLLLYI